MIALLGGSGYVGNAFARLFERESIPFVVLTRNVLDYSRKDVLANWLRNNHMEFLVNAAGYTGKPNVDACEIHRGECLAGNGVLPATIAEACAENGVPWGHVSSGCIYSGSRPDGKGFTELDPPNFCFRSNNCSFYSGCKAIGEECLIGKPDVYVWRLRIPFSNVNGPRNYLSKLIAYQKLLEATNSISQLDEFVSACWQTRARRTPYGTYNIVNTGAITTKEVAEAINRIRGINKQMKYFVDETEFMTVASKAPRSNCTLDNRKLLSTGIAMMDVHDAIERSLRNWVE